MRSGRRVLLAFWLAIQLLAGQQLALAHAVDHLGEAIDHHADVTNPAAEDQEDNSPREPAHVCATCVSCLGFDAMPAGGAGAALALQAWARCGLAAVSPAPTFRRGLPFRSRAPPVLQA